MPNANRLPVGIMAMVAEEERRMISKRTKDALSPPNVVAHRR
jgi:DNA invertase Pin-like site-specific DNA recombinase